MKLKTLLFILFAVLIFAQFGSSGQTLADDKKGIKFFESKIRPILKDKCYECHSLKKQESNLRLDHITFVKKGGDRGKAIDLDDPLKSRLLTALTYENEDEDLEMPPEGKLDDEHIEAFKKWIEMGAPWPKEPVPKSAPKTDK